MTSAVKLSDALVASAKAESKLMSRSMTQQIEHWARIGRALERSGAVSIDRVRAALAAELAYDELDTHDRVAYLNGLESTIWQPNGVDALAAELSALGTPLSTIDASGEVVMLAADGTTTPWSSPE